METEYTRYGIDWQNEMMKNPKMAIVQMLRGVAIERDDLQRAKQQEERVKGLQPCGHPLSAIVTTGEGTNYCGQCADESLRKNIIAGVEA